MVSCCVPGCKNKSTKTRKEGLHVTYHRFPSDPLQRKLWMQNMKRDHWPSWRNCYVCSVHFTEDAFEQDVYWMELTGEKSYRKIKKGKRPTIFDGDAALLAEQSRQSYADRRKRNVLRRQIIALEKLRMSLEHLGNQLNLLKTEEEKVARQLKEMTSNHELSTARAAGLEDDAESFFLVLGEYEKVTLAVNKARAAKDSVSFQVKEFMKDRMSMLEEKYWPKFPDDLQQGEKLLNTEKRHPQTSTDQGTEAKHPLETPSPKKKVDKVVNQLENCPNEDMVSTTKESSASAHGNTNNSRTDQTQLLQVFRCDDEKSFGKQNRDKEYTNVESSKTPQPLIDSVTDKPGASSVGVSPLELVPISLPSPLLQVISHAYSSAPLDTDTQLWTLTSDDKGTKLQSCQTTTSLDSLPVISACVKDSSASSLCPDMLEVSRTPIADLLAAHGDALLDPDAPMPDSLSLFNSDTVRCLLEAHQRQAGYGTEAKTDGEGQRVSSGPVKYIVEYTDKRASDQTHLELSAETNRNWTKNVTEEHGVRAASYALNDHARHSAQYQIVAVKCPDLPPATPGTSQGSVLSPDAVQNLIVQLEGKPGAEELLALLRTSLTAGSGSGADKGRKKEAAPEITSDKACETKSGKSLMALALETVDSKKAFECEQCHMRYTKNSTLRRHMLIHEGKSKHQCQLCGKQSMSKLRLETHMRIHTGDRPYTCSLCDASFTNRSNRRRHMLTHTGERPYKCVICAKAYNQRSLLKIHMRIHTGEKPYQCPECPKNFGSRGRLNNHSWSHGKTGPQLSEALRSRTRELFPCDQCEKVFTKKFRLTKHKRIHDGLSPYVCDECGKGFTAQQLLINHRRIHTGEKPYGCYLCAARFATKCNLARHQLVHSGYKPYVCNACGKSFGQKTQLQYHWKVRLGKKDHLVMPDKFLPVQERTSQNGSGSILPKPSNEVEDTNGTTEAEKSTVNTMES